MLLEIIIFMRGNPKLGPFEGVGNELFGPKMANFVQWPLLKDVTRELKVHRGTTKLEQFIIIFRGPFTASVC
jgi:hypothetical protein